MRSQILAGMPIGLFFVAAIGCSAIVGQEEATDGLSQEATACPASSSSDDQMRAAATAAFNIMRDAAKAGGAMPYNTAIPASQAALAPQRYRIQSSGTGIEFDPTDGLYSKVSNQMKADLAIAQLDASVAKFLSDGLNRAYQTTNGQYYPSIRAIGVLSNYNYPGPTTMKIQDPTSSDNSHKVTATGAAWCGTQLVTLNEMVSNSWQFSPLYSDQITTWRGSPPAAFRGSSSIPATPFNGPSSAGNPYLVVSVNGAPTNWAAYNFTPVSCYNYPNATCTGSIQIDPVPYAEPGAYYNTTGIVGTQANPYSLVATTLYAVPEHASQWATRTVGGVQEWGIFSTPVSVFGVTVYKYARQF